MQLHIEAVILHLSKKGWHLPVLRDPRLWSEKTSLGMSALSSILFSPRVADSFSKAQITSLVTRGVDLVEGAMLQHPKLIPNLIKYVLGELLAEPEAEGASGEFDTSMSARERMKLGVIARLCGKGLTAIVSRTGALHRGVRVSGQQRWPEFGFDAHYHLWQAAAEQITQPWLLSLLRGNDESSLAEQESMAILQEVGAVGLFLVTQSPWDPSTWRKNLISLLLDKGLLAALCYSCIKMINSKPNSPQGSVAAAFRWIKFVAAGKLVEARDFIARAPGIARLLLSKQLLKSSRVEGILWSILLEGEWNRLKIKEDGVNSKAQPRPKRSARSLLSVKSRGTRRSGASSEAKIRTRPQINLAPGWRTLIEDVVSCTMDEIKQATPTSSVGSSTSETPPTEIKSIQELEGVLRGLMWTGMAAETKVRTELASLVTAKLRPAVSLLLRSVRARVRSSREKKAKAKPEKESESGSKSEKAQLQGTDAARQHKLLEHLCLLDSQFKDMDAGGNVEGGKAD